MVYIIKQPLLLINIQPNIGGQLTALMVLVGRMKPIILQVKKKIRLQLLMQVDPTVETWVIQLILMHQGVMILMMIHYNIGGISIMMELGIQVTLQVRQLQNHGVANIRVIS